MILAEQDDEWQDGRCYFRPETMAANVLAGQQEVGQGAPDGELIRSGARTTLLHHVLGLDRRPDPSSSRQ
jgi:hypothetical protein